MSLHERTGWRDETMSRWHRCIGKDMYLTDIDSLWLEYSSGSLVAVMEYKAMGAHPHAGNASGCRAISDLARRAGIPAFLVKYDESLTTFFVVDLARGMWDETTRRLTRSEYLTFLYSLRGLKVPPEIWAASEAHR